MTGACSAFAVSAIRVNQHRNLLLAEYHQDSKAVGRIIDAVRGHAFDGGLPVIDCLGESDSASNGQRLCDLGHNHAQA